ncbi:hypothetical protein KSX_57230 [Ktedonospora formicarum]|uniref:Uncharacterized protein n=1 Tax=Ktedonospora formicarum TaxID=2778364 RepID=A0A8J3MTV7_9CHLR|nr:hypothetical protein KSX_57230 [Ktedonospora formicarum]
MYGEDRIMLMDFSSREHGVLLCHIKLRTCVRSLSLVHFLYELLKIKFKYIVKREKHRDTSKYYPFSQRLAAENMA